MVAPVSSLSMSSVPMLWQSPFDDLHWNLFLLYYSGSSKFTSSTPARIDLVQKTVEIFCAALLQRTIWETAVFVYALAWRRSGDKVKIQALIWGQGTRSGGSKVYTMKSWRWGQNISLVIKGTKNLHMVSGACGMCKDEHQLLVKSRVWVQNQL